MRRWFEVLFQDLGYAIRSFRRSPAQVGVALLSLMLGIGATAAIFSVVYGVLIAPYPYARPGEIWAPQARAVDGRGGHASLLEGVSAIPGVQSASIGLPFGGPQSAYAMPGEALDEARRITVNLAGADHLRTFGIPLRAGRMFDQAEVRRGDRVAVINEAAARLWPAGQDPIGTQLKLGVLSSPPARAFADTERPAEVTIVGVIANTRNAGIRSEPVPVVVVPFTVIAPPQRMLAVRMAGDPNQLINPLRAAVRAIDAEQPLGRPFTMGEILGQEVVQSRFTMALFAVFAALGLALAAAGIYSVLSFHVSLRTHEIGVRMALGAPRRNVLALMLLMGGRLVGIGLAVGVAASLAATRFLRSQLFGVEPGDPLAYAAVVLLLGAVTLVACYIPARRAAGVDPMVALRLD